MRNFTLLLLTLYCAPCITLYAQWQPMDGPYGYVTVFDLKENNNILFAGTECGVFAKPASDSNWQRINYRYTPKIFTKGDSVFTSIYHSLGVIDVNDPNLNEYQYPYSGNPFINGPSLAFRDSLMFISSNEGVYFSTTWGDSVIQYNTGLEHDTFYIGNTEYYRLYISDVLTTQGHVYCAGTGGIYRSDYSLSGWHKKNDGIHGATINNLYHADGILYALSSDSLYTSADDGETWTAIFGSPVPLDDFCKWNQNLYLTADTVGVLRLANGATTWDTIKTGIEGKRVNALETAGNDLYCMVVGEGIYKWDGSQWSISNHSGMTCTPVGSVASTDSGIYVGAWRSVYFLEGKDTWKNVAPITDPEWFFGDIATAGDTLMIPGYHASMTGLADSLTFFYSTDHGASWQSFDAPAFPHHELHQVQLRGIGDTIYALHENRLYYTMNLGQTWTNITPTNPIACVGINDLVHFDGQLYLATCQSSSVMRYDAGASDWTNEFVGTSGGADMYRFMRRDSALFLQSFDQVFRKYEGETIWQRVNNGWQPNYAEAFINAGENLFVASYDGVYRTDDFGGTWQSYNDSLPSAITAYDIAIFEDTLYIATSRHGVFRRALPTPGISTDDILLASDQVDVYPNPANEYFIVETPKAAKVQVEIHAPTGKVVLRTEVTTGEKILLPQHLIPGAYLLMLDWEGNYACKKLLVK